MLKYKPTKFSDLKWLVLLIFLGVSNAIYSQSTSGGTTKAQRKAEKAKQEQVKKQQKAEDEGRKRHLKLQSKDVKKRWKKNKKRYKHVDAFDRRPNFWQRIFPRKRPENR